MSNILVTPCSLHSRCCPAWRQMHVTLSMGEPMISRKYCGLWYRHCGTPVWGMKGWGVDWYLMWGKCAMEDVWSLLPAGRGGSRRKKDTMHRKGKEEGPAAYLHRSALEGAAEVGLAMKVSGNGIYLEMLGLEEVYLNMSGEENDWLGFAQPPVRAEPGLITPGALELFELGAKQGKVEKSPTGIKCPQTWPLAPGWVVRELQELRKHSPWVPGPQPSPRGWHWKSATVGGES